MNLAKILKEKTNAEIIWCLRGSKRKYSDIMKQLRERDSGRINYHLKKLISQNIIKKENEHYELTSNGVKYALYVDSLRLKEKYPLPVVLVAIVKDNKILLAKRCRVPCKNRWGLPGNEILYGESPMDAAKKEISTELGFQTFEEKIYGTYPTVYSEGGKILYHVILIAVKAKVNDIPETGSAIGKISKYKFFNKKELEGISIIPSNLQPIIDAFSKRKKICVQTL